ncbi:hypothetical protein D5F01_LYC16468 [Larimichthys crocea]|uniref:C2H2-type domain-containing protein n=1 Tax=Larimichthys crocea TaxID=215358 RepID=A0A6G0I174_LARCR|nr:hypothetical protein D5F01_LYC16468 [Larimichthys crocea]
MVAWEGAEGPAQPSDEQLEEPAVKKQRTEGSEQCAVETVAVGDTDGELLSTDSNTEDSQPEASSLFPDCILMEEGGSTGGSDVAEVLEESRAAEVHSCSSALSPAGRLSEDSQQVNLDEMPQDKDAPLASPDNPEEGEEGVVEGTNKFYCYLCSITCHNQQNFRSHMNSMSLFKGQSKTERRKKTRSIGVPPVTPTSPAASADHRRTEEHKLASRTAISSCTLCKKHFRTSQIFVEHLQSQEHRQKVEKLQEEEGSEALGKLTAMDTDGFCWRSWRAVRWRRERKDRRVIALRNRMAGPP